MPMCFCLNWRQHWQATDAVLADFVTPESGIFFNNTGVSIFAEHLKFDCVAGI